MATGLPDTRQTTETEECNEECSGKKKSRFKTFKNFFAKKKRKVADTAKGESSLKPSLSSTDVSTAQPSEVQPDTEIGTQSNIGSRAFSHDSIFIPELSVSEAVPVGGTSQEHTAGRVKALQLEQDIRLPSPSVLITSRKTEDPGMFSEDHGLPRSPLEISSLHAVLRCSTPKSAAPDERQNSLSFGGTESEDEEMIFSIASSRPLSPLVPMATTSDSLPVGFSSPASSLASTTLRPSTRLPLILVDTSSLPSRQNQLIENILEVQRIKHLICLKGKMNGSKSERLEFSSQMKFHWNLVTVTSNKTKCLGQGFSK